MPPAGLPCAPAPTIWGWPIYRHADQGSATAHLDHGGEPGAVTRAHHVAGRPHHHRRSAAGHHGPAETSVSGAAALLALPGLVLSAQAVLRRLLRAATATLLAAGAIASAVAVAATSLLVATAGGRWHAHRPCHHRGVIVVEHVVVEVIVLILEIDVVVLVAEPAAVVVPELVAPGEVELHCPRVLGRHGLRWRRCRRERHRHRHRHLAGAHGYG